MAGGSQELNYVNQQAFCGNQEEHINIHLITYALTYSYDSSFVMIQFFVAFWVAYLNKSHIIKKGKIFLSTWENQDS